MTLKDLLKCCLDENLILNVTALAYFKEDKSYDSFRTICNKYCEEVRVKDYAEHFSEEDLALEVKGFSYSNDTFWDDDIGTLWIDVIEWIDT